MAYFIPHPSALIPFFRRRSQVVRQRSAKPLFVGSIPTAAFNCFNHLQGIHSSMKKATVVGIVSVVECDLAKVEVASSNLVSRLFETNEGGGMRDEKEWPTSSLIPPPSFPFSGGVAKW